METLGYVILGLAFFAVGGGLVLSRAAKREALEQPVTPPKIEPAAKPARDKSGRFAPKK